MNSQKYKIQALIAEIDEVLSKPAPRLPWTGSLDTVHQRQLLERVRAYLVSSDSKLPIGDRPRSPSVRPAPVPVPKVPMPPQVPSAAEQIMLAVTGEISNLRSTLTGPLQEDIEALRQQQQALIQEIKQLEAKRQQQQSLAQQQANQQQIISEFLQVLTGHLTETLDRDFSQILGSLENQLLSSSAAQFQQSALIPQNSEEQPLLTPAQRIEQMEQFQARAESLLMSLDSTAGMVFEGLEAKLQSYQTSLSQGLENMYGLSQQSEAVFATFVNHLAAQLGREASSYVQQPLAKPSQRIALANLETETPSAADRSNTAFLAQQDRFPYAGTEISSQLGQLRHDRDRIEAPLSFSDLEDNLFGSAPEIPESETRFSGAESEDILAENGEDVEDLYASLFAGKEVAELELEFDNFTIENTASAAESEAVESQDVDFETAEPLNKAEDLLANLLDEGESLEDYLVGENSDFVIGNSVEDLTLDSEDLFEPQVAKVPQVSEPAALSSIAPQVDSDDRENLETAKNLDEDEDTAAVPAPPALNLPPEISPHQPSAADVRTGEFDTSSPRLDDGYIQASPDEDLLPVEGLENDFDRALNLDNNTLELLEADLYNLEGLENTALGRSNSSAVNSLDWAANSSDGAENPFAEVAEEELGSLEDLFSDVLALSSEDEQFVLEDELGDDLLAQEDESKLTLDDILASLMETDRALMDTAETDGVRSSPPESKKKT
ncbi:hypothetical protein [Tychonema sp. LEGE 07203]|uniref:hypothetical protein n=1 Tax=Tychonema sp. LEGE 07203 TaxID=1828671 RepID=UPI001881B0F7|nr:hypothetical protein [Tychonema sp. LEGE 07203]MBE9092598.1 hypothetical protein [Tychonema sp. LEGE 07203]